MTLHCDPAAPSGIGISRRRFLRLCSACLTAASAIVTGCASLFRAGDGASPTVPLSCAPPRSNTGFDYIVVGSGAGGGPLAANLARAGFTVLLLEAGGDEKSDDYRVPAFHARASEDEHMAWNFFVRHYSDDSQQRRDDKFCPAHNGVLYPRSATLGGCTAHNAMILVYPHNSDWNHIADLTGDRSWNSDNMRSYFERLERCEYLSCADAGDRHGFDGWLATNVADPFLVVRDFFVQVLFVAALRESAGSSLRAMLDRALGCLKNGPDPNGWRFVQDGAVGVCSTPLTTHKGRRVGSREYVRKVQSACPERLVVRTHALATRVLFDETNRASGVEYLAGERLYRADPRYRPGAAAERLRATAKREVILCAGAFNTPQLLKLSGIGPRQELECHGIPVRVDLPGVGENLQDRYEISVVTRMKADFSLMKGMKLRPPVGDEAPDPQFREWLVGKGPYTTNGAVVSMIKRSSSWQPEPDLFIFGLLGSFRGYFPGYSSCIAQEEDLFTWAILKAHTNNTCGQVTLRSNDPTEVPEINFHYFAGDAGGDADLAAVVDGLKTARCINDRCREIIAEEVLPGNDVTTEEQIRQYIKDNAWGHHACGTCKMGPVSDPLAVVDSRFRVHGLRNLRVVDASIFPKIPGFFIVSSVYMVSEKASDVIIEDANIGRIEN
jgi:choline dehydrogenase